MFALRHAARPGRSRAPTPARRRPPALRLQRAIGNRATAQLLRQAVTPEEDVAAERARFDQARAEHGRRLTEIDARDRPHALKATGVKTTAARRRSTCARTRPSGTPSTSRCTRSRTPASSGGARSSTMRETLRTRFNLTLHQMVLELQAEKFCARL